MKIINHHNIWYRIYYHHYSKWQQITLKTLLTVLTITYIVGFIYGSMYGVYNIPFTHNFWTNLLVGCYWYAVSVTWGLAGLITFGFFAGILLWIWHSNWGKK